MINNWIITGGCGFLGIALINKLLKLGVTNIRIIDNLSVGSKNDLKNSCNFREINFSEITASPNGLELIVGDILDPDLAVNVTKGCNIIAHLAANTGVQVSVKDPRADMLVNVIGTFNYLEAARINKVSKFIFASSGAPVGEVEPPIHEEIVPHPISPYGASKLSGEGYCSVYNKTYGIETIILRFSNVYGPGSLNKSSVVAKFIQNALSDQLLEIYGDGTQTRDFIYIDDLIDAVISSSKSSKIGGETFQIANNHETTITEIKNLVLKELSNYDINNVQVKNVSIKPGDVKRNYSTTNKAKLYLAWEPKVQLKEGIRLTVKYFINRKSKN